MSVEQQAPPIKTRLKKTPPPKPERCLNCGAAATGKFCAECGQENEDQTIALKLLVGDLLSDLASFDSKLFRTLVPLLVRPGFLTNEYNAGKRVCYLSPFKLYLTASLVFFLVLPLTGRSSMLNVNVDPSGVGKGAVTIQTAQQSAAAKVAAAKAQLKADEDYKEAQADIKDAAPGLTLPPLSVSDPPAPNRVHSKLLSGDFTHLPKTVEAYNAQQRDPHHTPDPKLVQFMKRQLIKVTQNPQSLSTALLNDIPKMMFVMLPLFALSLKLLYLRSKRLYIEHLIFSLHLHAFLFTVLTLLLGVQALWPGAAFAGPVVTLAALLYVYCAMRVVYKQGWMKTFVKYNLLAFNYILLVAFTLLGTVAVAFLFV